MEHQHRQALTMGGRVALTVAALLLTTVGILMAAAQPSETPLGAVALLATSMALVWFSMERPRRR